jgi:hypothetical protein
MSPALTLLFLVSWILAIATGARIGINRGRKAPAIVLAVLLGWIGVLLAAICLKTTEAEQLRRAETRLRIEQQARANIENTGAAPTPAAPDSAVTSAGPLSVTYLAPRAARRRMSPRVRALILAAGVGLLITSAETKYIWIGIAGAAMTLAAAVSLLRRNHRSPAPSTP